MDCACGKLRLSLHMQKYPHHLKDLRRQAFFGLRIKVTGARPNVDDVGRSLPCASALVRPPPGPPKPTRPSLLAEKPLLRPFLACGCLRFPVSAQRHRLQVPFGASVSGGKNPVPNSTSQESAGGGVVSPGSYCWSRNGFAYSTGVSSKIPFLADKVWAYFWRSVSALKTQIRDWFDDWVVGSQFRS